MRAYERDCGKSFAAPAPTHRRRAFRFSRISARSKNEVGPSPAYGRMTVVRRSLRALPSSASFHNENGDLS